MSINLRRRSNASECIANALLLWGDDMAREGKTHAEGKGEKDFCLMSDVGCSADSKTGK
jgi:hypothetical protein